MRARFYELQPDGQQSQTIYCDQFPAFLAHVKTARLASFPERARIRPVCLKSRTGISS